MASHSIPPGMSAKEYADYCRTFPYYRRLNWTDADFDDDNSELFTGRVDRIDPNDPETEITSYAMAPSHLITENEPGVEQTSPFLRIPGELRNIIYNHVIPQNATYEVAWLSPRGKGRSLTHWKYKTAIGLGNWYREVILPKQYNHRLQERASKQKRAWDRIFTAPGWDPVYQSRRRREMHEGWRTKNVALSILDPVRGPAALLRVCKKIHHEAAQIFYSQNRLSFMRPNILDAFKTRLTPIALEYITKLCLHHRGYGESMNVESIKWKEKHDRRWAERVKSLVKDFRGLEELSISLHIVEKPTGLDIDAKWAVPLLVLAQLPNLQRFELEFRASKWTTQDNCKFTRAARRVEKAILGDKFDDEKLIEAKHRAGVAMAPSRPRGGRVGVEKANTPPPKREILPPANAVPIMKKDLPESGNALPARVTTAVPSPSKIKEDLKSTKPGTAEEAYPGRALVKDSNISSKVDMHGPPKYPHGKRYLAGGCRGPPKDRSAAAPRASRTKALQPNGSMTGETSVEEPAPMRRMPTRADIDAYRAPVTKSTSGDGGVARKDKKPVRETKSRPMVMKIVN